MQILVVDGQIDRRDPLVHGLKLAGHRVIMEGAGAPALALITATYPDLIMLDMEQPDLDGLELCRRIRHTSSAPIILFGCGREDEVMQGYALGIDEYVTKPVSLRVAVARVETIVRRIAEQRDREPGRRPPECYVRVGGLEVDVQQFAVRMHGNPVQLTGTELRILHLLAANHGRVIPYSRLIAYAWGGDRGTPSSLKISVSKIRDKLGLPVNGRAGIKAVTATGYVLYGLTSASPTAVPGAA